MCEHTPEEFAGNENGEFIIANSWSFALPANPVMKPTLGWIHVQSIKSCDAKWLSSGAIIFVSGNCILRDDISFCKSLQILACLFMRPDLKMVVINSPDNPS